MSCSVDGDSQSGSSKKSRVSDKPWHMTWNASTKQLYVWKSGRRLDIGGGVSAGPVSAIECIDKHAVKVCLYQYFLLVLGTYQSWTVCVLSFVSQVIGDREGKAWKARLSLTKVEKEANELMSSIAVHLCDSHMFCKAVNEATGGEVEYGGGGSTTLISPSTKFSDVDT